MRGKRQLFVLWYLVIRITPAGAGKTRRFKSRVRVLQDHPRRCGENGYVPKRRQWGIGSPPQVRGKQVYDRRIVCCFRITPAGAGKTASAFGAGISSADHPRRCGENMMETAATTFHRGSPPQVRGKLAGHNCAIQRRRITPAGAGKTLTG